MEVIEYPDWTVEKRLWVDGYPLLLLQKDERRIVVSEGYYKNIIEFLLNASKPHEPWVEERNGVRLEGIDHLLHQGFVSGEGWAISGVFYGHLIQPEEFEEHRQDPEFVEEQGRYQKRFGRPLDQPVWHVSVNSGDWRNVAQYIPKSSIQKIIELEAALLRGEAQLLGGVSVVQGMPPCPFMVRIDGFVLRVEQQEQGLKLIPADEHDRNELLRYFAGAVINPELEGNLLQLKSERSTPVLWYYPIQPSEFPQWANTVEFDRVRQDYQHTRADSLEEPVWTYKFVPTMQLSTFMAHSTVLTLMEVARAITAGHAEFPEGVEVYSEDEWAIQFDQAEQKGLLMPSLLKELERAAHRYASLFERGAGDYTPDEAAFWRGELLGRLEQANLINCTVAPVIFEQLEEYPHLSNCVNTAEFMWNRLNLDDQGLRIQDSALSLDWMMFDPFLPAETGYWGGVKACLEAVEAATLEHPRSLPIEMGGLPSRLLTGWDNGRIKLLHALELDPNQVNFKDVYKPTFLELLEWASLPRGSSPAMEWDVVVNWDDWIGTLADLASDPTLPEADYLRHCIYCHLAGLRKHEPQKMMGFADGLLQHPDPAIRRIGMRTQALVSGELEFVYEDWCLGGFNRKDQAETTKPKGRRKP